MIRKYRKNPVVIEAERWTGNEDHYVHGICRSNEHHSMPTHIDTLEGTMYVSDGDMIIKGVQGEFYPCKPNIFEDTYTLVEDDGVARVSGCPCTLVKPCLHNCSCANLAQRGGCKRCARYGDRDQQIAAARHLVRHEQQLQEFKDQAWIENYKHDKGVN